MRDVMMKENLNDSCKLVCDVYKEEFEKSWRRTLNESFESCSDERLSDGINKEAVWHHMKDTEVFKHHPIVFHVPF